MSLFKIRDEIKVNVLSSIKVNFEKNLKLNLTFKFHQAQCIHFIQIVQVSRVSNTIQK